jgi:hypothetical protein
MSEDEDPIVGTGAANKPQSETEGDNAGSALPQPKDDENVDQSVGKHRQPDDR